MYEESDYFLCAKEALITDLFLRPADENYLVARWSYLNGLYHSFYWNAAQAIEKYLKASLLFNNYPAKRQGHNLTALLSDVYKYADKLLPTSLTCPEQVRGHMPWKEENLPTFVTRINEEGQPDNRYNLNGLRKKYGDLYKLDIVTFKFRRLACTFSAYPYINPPREGEKTETLLDLLIEDALFMPQREPLFCNKWRGVPNDIKTAFFQNNFPFAHVLCPDFEHLRLRQNHSYENPALYTYIFSVLERGPAEEHIGILELIQWIKSNILINSKEHRKLLEMVDLKLKEKPKQQAINAT